jgi:hypothetical protein
MKFVNKIGYPRVSEVSTADAVTAMYSPVSSIPTATHLFLMSDRIESVSWQCIITICKVTCYQIYLIHLGIRTRLYPLFGVIIPTFYIYRMSRQFDLCNCAAQVAVTGQRLMVKHWKRGRFMKDCPYDIDRKHADFISRFHEKYCPYQKVRII